MRPEMGGRYQRSEHSMQCCESTKVMKKLLYVGLAALVTVYAVKHSSLGSLVKSKVTDVRTWADDQVPFEKKIEMLRIDVATLDKDIDTLNTALAVEVVDVEELKDVLAKKRANVKNEKETLVTRANKLKDTEQNVSVNEKSFSLANAKASLKRDVALHVRKSNELESLTKTLAHRETTRDQYQAQLVALKNQREELRVEVDALEAEYNELTLQEIENKYQRDDSRLSNIKERLAEMRKSLKVRKTKHDLETMDAQGITMSDDSESVDQIISKLDSE